MQNEYTISTEICFFGNFWHVKDFLNAHDDATEVWKTEKAGIR